jgi:hypothetical protein
MPMRWALCAFVALMAVQAPRVPGPLPLGWAELFFPLAVLGVAWRIVRRRAPLPIAPAALFALAYAAWVAISAAVHHAGGWVALGALELALVMIVTAALPDERRRLVRVWVWASAALCVIGIVTALLATSGVAVDPLFSGSGELGLTLRPAGLCRTGTLAQFSLVPVFVLMGDGERVTGRWRWPLAILIAATLAATLTRTLLAAAVGLIALGVMRAQARWRAGAVAVVGLAVVAVVSMRLDLHGADGAFRVTSAPGIRWRIARSALERAARSPLFGVGPAEPAAIAGWPTAGDPALPWDAHSTALDLAATRGLPALALWVATAALVVASAVRRRGDALHTALVAALVATIFDAITVDVEDARHVWVLFGLVAAAGGRANGGRPGVET